MEFEQLLRKYLSGAITDPELEHFQSLLDRVPEYEAELRQTLEIRSMLHDDALTLTPPSDLSEHIRIAVSSSFAADALVEQEEQARKRRVFLNPIRLSVGALVAACVIAGVALSPTLPRNMAGSDQGSGRASGRAADRIASVRQAPAATGIAASGIAASGITAPGGTASRNDRASRGTNAAERAGVTYKVVRAAAHGSEKTVADAGTSRDLLAGGMWMLGHEVPTRAAHGGASERPASSIAQYQIDGGNVSTSASDLAALLSRDPAELLKRDFGRPLYNPSFDSSMHRHIEPSRSDAKPGEAIAMAGGEERRTLTIGVALGSGQVMKTESPTAMMQNSYYLSFSLGGYDRIGVEMGASAFQQESKSAPSYGKPNQFSNDPLLLGSVRPTQGVIDGSQYGLIGNNEEIHLGKKTAGIPSNVDGAPTASAPQRTSQEPPKTIQEETKLIEKQISYGAVFYDRRLQVSRTWDVCGRVTFGAADNALMGNVRAYAAFTPSEKKNITLTMGVGSATLYHLNVKQDSHPKASFNYGIYYGIETGF